jgi:hypothetical protein
VMTLPTGAAEGVQISAEKVDASTNTVTVSGNMRGLAGQTFELEQQYSRVEFIADAAGSWWPTAHAIQLAPSQIDALDDIALAETDVPAAPSATPLAGGEDTYSRGDHVHPSAGLYIPWGTGFDGDLNFDGTTTVVLTDAQGFTSNLVPASGVYTINLPISARTISLGNNVVLAVGQGCTISVSDVLSCAPGWSATIHADGNPGLANGTAGAARATNLIGNTGAGGAGNTGAGSSGSSVGGAGADQWNVGLGAAGGLGPSGAGGGISGGALANQTELWNLGRSPDLLLRGEMKGFRNPNGPAWIVGSGGGGGGGGDGTNKGGGGGSGAGVLIVNARKIVGNITFRANGGNGGSPTTGNAGGGGGGGGGLVLVNSTDLTTYTGPSSSSSRATHAKGGTGGTKVGTGVNGTAGGNGFIYVTQWA